MGRSISTRVVLSLAGLGLCGSALALDDNDLAAARTEKVLRAVYDIERAYLRYHAKSDPLSVIPTEVSPLFPKFGFEPSEPLLKWKVIRGSTGEEVKLCFVHDTVNEKDALIAVRVKAKLLDRDYALDGTCQGVVGVSTGVGYSKIIKRATIATKNKLPSNVQVLGLQLHADKPSLSFKAKSNKWSSPQTFLVYKEKPAYDFVYRPLLTSVIASEQFDTAKSCYSSFFEDWCYVSVYYFADADSPSKLGTITLTFNDGQKGLISVQGAQQVASSPSKKYLRRARGW